MYHLEIHAYHRLVVRTLYVECKVADQYVLVM